MCGQRVHVLIISLLLIVLAAWRGYAQDGVVITISFPQAEEAVFRAAIERFETQNPAIKVNIISNPFDFGTSMTNVDERLDAILADVRQADVVVVDETSLTVEATRAGYFLDLTPLVIVDNMLDESGFYPAMWRSYQWDNGIWALPYEGDVTVLMYDRMVFDNEGLFYPQMSWGLTDLESALRELAVYDDQGNVVEGAVLDVTNNQAVYAMMVGLLGHGLYDDTFLPSVPRFDDPTLEEYLTIWARVQRDGLLGNGGFDAPMLILPSVFASIPRIADGRTVVELPGGQSNITVNAFAISAGTQNPEAAYNLARFLTFSEDVAHQVTAIPARQSLSTRYFEQYSADVSQVIESTLNHALPVSEMRFASFIEDAVTRMVVEDMDARGALNMAEEAALDALRIASGRFGVDEIIVQMPTVIRLAPGEIAVKFAVSSIIVPLPAQDEWDRLIEDFVTSDPEVGHVQLDARQGFLNVDLESLSAHYDCFYLPNNEVQGADLSLLRSLDPLLSADPGFDRSDFVGNVLAQVERNGQVWAIPLVVQPEVMFYNPEVFNRYGVSLPSAGWSVSEFEDVLRSLKLTDDDPSPFVPQSLGGTYMQVLIVAYGGIAIDYRVAPPVFRFDQPDVFTAAQQVLDLAKDGYIQYDGLATNLGFNLFNTPPDPDAIALYNRLLNPLADLPFLPGRNHNEVDRLISFPQGSRLNAVSYDLGAAYISALSPHAEACYRLIGEIARTPALFKEMPARRSLIHSPELIDSQGRDAAEFYLSLDRLMSAPNTVLIPTPLSGGLESASYFLATLWLNRAFDRYVFEDADLERELQDAQQYATEFIACSENLPPINPAEDDFVTYIQQVLDCAISVDPSFEELLGLG